jgi:hypothetical protein
MNAISSVSMRAIIPGPTFILSCPSPRFAPLLGATLRVATYASI